MQKHGRHSIVLVDSGSSLKKEAFTRFIEIEERISRDQVCLSKENH